jgi:hypothetical protein
VVAAWDAVPFPARGARHRERRCCHTGRAGRQDVFPAGKVKGGAGEAGSVIARVWGKISADRCSWRPVDGKAERGTLPGPERRCRTRAVTADALT